RGTRWSRQCLLQLGHIALATLLEIVEDRQHARAAFGAVVIFDMQLGDALQAQLAEPAAYERHRMRQRTQSLLALGRRADDRNPHAGVAQVRADLDVGNRHEADARVIDLATNDVAYLFAEQLIDARRALA